MDDAAMPSKNSKWLCKRTGMTARVMADAEGWVMVRFKGGAPFCLHKNDWHVRFVTIHQNKARA